MEKEFHDQAGVINRADSLLVNNADNIARLNETLERLKGQQTKIDQQLDFIVYQQNELEKLLEPLENCRIETSGDPASEEREFTYNMIESVNSELASIGGDLESFIKKLNDNKTNSDPSDPLSSISKVLNAHMDALVYIESQVKSTKATLSLLDPQ